MRNRKLSEFNRYERPVFHLTPEKGWMNDPNGFSRTGGTYHLFYQSCPESTDWGPTRWGHAVSGDLIRWKRLPDALLPDRDYDGGGCFSGTALALKDGRHMLMYTGHRPDPEDERGRGLQTQCIAFGDGKRYEKYRNNPVITGEDLPEGGDPHEFRDPKLWQETDGSYRAAIANHHETRGPRILLYRSGDGLTWTCAGTLAESKGKPGWMWECPDFFPLEGKDILMVGTMGDVRVIGMIGEYDRRTGTFREERWQTLEQGLDFYAGQTVRAADGRRILIGWLQNPQTAEEREIDLPINGQMSVPRELRLRDGLLLQRPVRELEACRTEETVYRDVRLGGGKEIRLEGVRGRVLDLEISIRPEEAGTCEQFRMRFAADGQRYTEFAFDPAASAATLDRSRSGPGKTKLTRVQTKVRDRKGRLDLRVLLDRLSAEIFINDGEQVMSAVIYTDRRAEDITFCVKGTAVMDIATYRIKENVKWQAYL